MLLFTGGTTWMDWCLYAAVIMSFPLMLSFREQYRRLMVDQRRVVSPLSLEVSAEHGAENTPGQTSPGS